jgi:hypothetical protein
VPDLPELLSYSGYAVTDSRKFVVSGGHHPSNAEPGPTSWKYSNRVYSLDLNDVEVDII